MIDTGLKGKTVIVTGANHGIGAAIAIAFAREGVRVLITFLRQSPGLYGETKANVESATTPGRAFYCRANRLDSCRHRFSVQMRT